MEEDMKLEMAAEDNRQLTQLEIARIIGEPKDPRRPYSALVDSVCDTDTAEPEDYTYYFDVLQDTDKIYVITSTGAVTQENVTPDTPALLTFADIATPEYYFKFTDLAKKKEQVIARKLITINRALNAYENYKVISLIDGAVQSGNTYTLDSGDTRFDFPKLIDMIDGVVDYGDNYTLIMGSTVNKDITRWDWNDNKYHSLKQAFADLNVDTQRVGAAQTVNIDGSPTSVLSSTVAYLVARDTEVGKPLLFVRKKLDSLKMLGGVIAQDGGMPERLVLSSPNPITVTGTARYLAYGVIGFEEIATAVVNPYALAKFTRS